MLRPSAHPFNADPSRSSKGPWRGSDVYFTSVLLLSQKHLQGVLQTREEVHLTGLSVVRCGVEVGEEDLNDVIS